MNILETLMFYQATFMQITLVLLLENFSLTNFPNVTALLCKSSHC